MNIYSQSHDHIIYVNFGLNDQEKARELPLHHMQQGTCLGVQYGKLQRTLKISFMLLILTIEKKGKYSWHAIQN